MNTKSATKETVFDGSRTFGRQDWVKRRSKRSLEIFCFQDKGEGARRQEMNLKPILHHRYDGRHVRTRDTERTESVETFQRRKDGTFVSGKEGGRERFRK
jgi:hypothetical protein